ncbi:MAG: MarC family protein [Thermoplasmata archaeon]|nr:MarC family protein [Thermoplasmata archaeon]
MVVEIFIAAFATIFSIVDPVGIIPVFKGLTYHYSAEERRSIIKRSVLFALIVLLIFAVFGYFIFSFFGITIDAFKVAGGILVFKIAFDMLQGERPKSKMTKEDEDEAYEREAIALFPLGVPLLAGPGAITAVMIYMGKFGGIEERIVVLLTIFLVMIATYIFLIFADRIFNKIGRVGSMAVMRLMGLILAAFAVQIFFEGTIGLLRLAGLVA